ncbi:MAG TPA: hypothetical protein VIQ24_21955 [Pyrinomonadaceae bacterium]
MKAEPAPDATDEISHLFGGNIELPGASPTPAASPEVRHDPPQPIPSPTIPHHPQKNAAPARDFNRRANSLERDALPAGLFPGSSKKIYDALYLRTRGAIQPRESVRATKRTLMDWSGIRNVKTVETHMRYLVGIGLLERTGDNGDREGFSYSVRLPEEVPTPTSTIPNPPQPTPTSTDTTQRSVVEGVQKTVMVGVGQSFDNIDTSEAPKTSFKTKEENSDDDAAARRLAAKLIEAERELTGKVSTSVERWEELAELLVTELRIAAARTTVSNVPAFLTEHLRRRLWKVDKTRAAEMTATEATGQGSASPALTPEQRRKCPDCAGVGFWYPEGPEKGVAKCRHASLAVPPLAAE